MSGIEYDNNYYYYNCHENKNKEFIYKLTDIYADEFLLDDFAPDNNEKIRISKNVPTFFHRYILKMSYYFPKYFKYTPVAEENK